MKSLGCAAGAQSEAEGGEGAHGAQRFWKQDAASSGEVQALVARVQELAAAAELRCACLAAEIRHAAQHRTALAALGLGCCPACPPACACAVGEPLRFAAAATSSVRCTVHLGRYHMAI